MKKQALQLEQERAAKLIEIGSRLRQFRQEQSISLEDIAERTHIQVRLLNAIETGRMDQLPEPVYIRGFIKQFADALGLDGSEFASDFPTGAIVRPVRRPWRALPAAQLRPIHLYLLYVGLIVFAVNGLSYVMNRSTAPNAGSVESSQQPQNGAIVDGTQVLGGSSLGPSISGVPLDKATGASTNPVLEGLNNMRQGAANTSKNNEPVRVSVTMKAQSWVRVVSDGKTEFEGVLTEGTERRWTAAEQLVLRAGNAGGVMVAFNDEKSQQLGEPGAVEEVTFEANPKSAKLPIGAVGENNRPSLGTAAF